MDHLSSVLSAFMREQAARDEKLAREHAAREEKLARELAARDEMLSRELARVQEQLRGVAVGQELAP